MTAALFCSRLVFLFASTFFIAGCSESSRPVAEPQRSVSKTTPSREPSLTMTGAEVLDEMKRLKAITPQVVRRKLGSPHWQATWNDGAVQHYYHASDGLVVQVVIEKQQVRLIDLLDSGTLVERLHVENHAPAAEH